MLKQTVNSYSWSWPFWRQTKIVDNEVNIWFLSLLSEPWPFECCANRPSTSHRISGSCSDQEDEREAPEKEAGQSQWNHLYKIFCSSFANVCRIFPLMVLNLSGSLQFWWIPLDYPLRLRRRRQRRWRRRWSLHDTKGHRPRRWRGKNCSMIEIVAKW